jgi:hypothetical protein
VSEQQEQQMIGLLSSINENVGGIRERMASMETKVDDQARDIADMKMDMKSEKIPSRVEMIERDLGRLGRAMWIIGTAIGGLLVHRAWEFLTGRESQ